MFGKLRNTVNAGGKNNNYQEWNSYKFIPSLEVKKLCMINFENVYTQIYCFTSIMNTEKIHISK